jgi:hypothetical protein
VFVASDLLVLAGAELIARRWEAQRKLYRRYPTFPAR